MSEQEIRNNFESKVSIKIETNTRGHVTSVHVYQGVTQKDIDATIESAIYANNRLHQRLKEDIDSNNADA